MGLGRAFFSIDRSYQVFGDETPEAQLKGRSEIITRSLVFSAFAIGLIALIAMGGHPGAFGYFLIGAYSLGFILNFKEVVIQSIARSGEKQQAGIKEETADTQYTLTELVEDFQKSFEKHLSTDAFRETMRDITNALFTKKAETPTTVIETE